MQQAAHSVYVAQSAGGRATVLLLHAPVKTTTVQHTWSEDERKASSFVYKTKNETGN
jgi:hypothetical protein